MNALETELQQAGARKPGSDPHRKPEAREAMVTTRPSGANHFSPDPMHNTDRYRLVTPYRLPQLG